MPWVYAESGGTEGWISVERVTEYTRFHGGMLAVLKNSNRYSAIERLATIEDILGDDYDLDRLRQLVEADRDGRCVVLPCKIGTPVYRILWHCGCAAMDDESYKYVSFPVPFAFDMINQFGKSVFLTSEEAEEAMKERRR